LNGVMSATKDPVSSFFYIAVSIPENRLIIARRCRLARAGERRLTAPIG